MPSRNELFGRISRNLARGLSSRSFALLASLLAAAALQVAQPTPARAYTPNSPEVKDMIKRAMGYLEGKHHEELGGDCLLGLVFVKDGKGENHPVVAKAVKRVRDAIATNTPEQICDKGSSALYSTGLACIFLCELDPVKYRREIDYIFGYILKRQMNGGGWSYPTYSTGDTSQTQYAVLSLWTAKHAGIPFPKESAEKVAGWLMRTQDIGGGFGYQGIEPTMGGRASQPNVTLSLSAAGLGSLYIASDVLDLTAGPTSSQNTGLPPALRLVTPENEKGKPAPATKMSIAQFQQAWSLGNRFFDSNFTIGGRFDYQMYYMYALERYMGFRELAEGGDDPEPRWYNEGVDYLMKVQRTDGAVFPAGGAITAEIDTAFAVLFLTRSTKKAIEKNVAGEGTLTGGRGLKGNMANARIKDGKIIAPPEKGAIDDLANILDDPRSLDIDALAEFPEGWLSDVTPEKLAPQLDRLRRLVHAEKFEVRLVAVRALGRSADYDSIPSLIYALTDPDPKIVRASNDGLRFIARKIEGYSLPDKYTENDRQGLIKRWKDWYKSVDPAAIFLD